jgi:4-alpha-glucanotransferase
MADLTETARLWGLESGYFDVFGRWRTASPETQAMLVAALSRGHERPPEIAATDATPIRAYQGDGRRHWGLAVQLYALRSRRNWGHGDFGDLARLIDLAASYGAAAIGVNPLHALFVERADEASPYAPNSRIYLNPLYIDVTAIPEFPGIEAAGLATTIETLRDGDMIDYAQVAQAKLAGLKSAYERFRNAGRDERRMDFEAYRQEQGDSLLRFACFETLRPRYSPRFWREWPAPWNSPDRALLRDFRQKHRDECEFHEFVQWVADRQLQACKETARRCGMSIGLYIDVAVGMHPQGADAWAQQDIVLANVSLGAPPDEFNPVGQDWGLASFNPHALAGDDFVAIRRLMASTMRYAGAIRLDHALGLQRMFMIPHACGASEGAYVRFPFEALLRIIAQESSHSHCIVIGEDLGTVPEGFRDVLARWGLWTYCVMLFERGDGGCFRPPEIYPAEALATFNTHDLPTLRGWFEAHDLRVKRAIGLDLGETDNARSHARQMLAAMFRERGFTGDVAAVAAFLAATPSRLVTIALDDVAGALDQINIPGTVAQHPNWRRKLPVLLEEIGSYETLRKVAEVFAQSGRGR